MLGLNAMSRIKGLCFFAREECLAVWDTRWRGAPI